MHRHEKQELEKWEVMTLTQLPSGRSCSKKTRHSTASIVMMDGFTSHMLDYSQEPHCGVCVGVHWTEGGARQNVKHTFIGQLCSLLEKENQVISKKKGRLGCRVTWSRADSGRQVFCGASEKGERDRVETGRDDQSMLYASQWNGYDVSCLVERLGR